MVEHPLAHDLTGSQDIAEKLKEQVKRSLSIMMTSSRISVNTPCPTDMAQGRDTSLC